MWKITLAVICVLCACSTQPTSSNLNATPNNALTSSGLGANATETIIADTVALLFAGTQAVNSTATSYAQNNPSRVPPTSTPKPDEEPTYAAREWFSAVLNGDGATVGRYTCATQAEVMSQASFLIGLGAMGLNSLISEIVPGLGSQVDTSGMVFSLLEQNGSIARVAVGGEAILSIGGGFETTQPNGVLIMVYEDNRWKWCDFEG